MIAGSMQWTRYTYAPINLLAQVRAERVGVPREISRLYSKKK